MGTTRQEYHQFVVDTYPSNVELIQAENGKVWHMDETCGILSRSTGVWKRSFHIMDKSLINIISQHHVKDVTEMCRHCTTQKIRKVLL